MGHFALWREAPLTVYSPLKEGRMSNAQEPLVLGIAALQRLFEESCERFRDTLGETESAADAVDFTGHMHNLSLAAGRVQAFGEALALLTGDQSWNDRATEVLRNYLSPDFLDS